jgi:hypothetical protein
MKGLLKKAPAPAASQNEAARPSETQTDILRGTGKREWKDEEHQGHGPIHETQVEIHYEKSSLKDRGIPPQLPEKAHQPHLAANGWR